MGKLEYQFQFLFYGRGTGRLHFTFLSFRYAMMLSTELLLPSILVYHLSHQGKVRSSGSPQFSGVYSDEINYYRIRVCQRMLSSIIFCTNKTSPPTVIISFDVP